MKSIKYFIALFIFMNVLSCTSDTTVEDAEIAKLEQEKIEKIASGGDTGSNLDDDKDD